jgi:hypothetical protein
VSDAESRDFLQHETKLRRVEGRSPPVQVL